MKEYNVYVPVATSNGTTGSSKSWSWLEKLLDTQFGNYQVANAVHEGEWRKARVNLQGRIRAYTVQGERTTSRAFFRKLKKSLENAGHADFLIVEKEASDRQGEVTGERI